MTKNKLLYICETGGGLLLVVLSIILHVQKPLSGAALGVGVSFFGLGLMYLLITNWESKRPNVRKQKEIEQNDERNTMIRDKAKAKAADITQWFIMGLVYMTILIESPLWVTLITVGVFMLYHILTSYYSNKYQKEL